jgi:GntR family transcriptional regulator
MQWNNQKPIYQQLKDMITERILDGSIQEGEAIPSIRTISADLQVNPMTVSKAYQALVDDRVLEKRRGMGMFVNTGAMADLLALERKRFLENEWPHIAKKIKQLKLSHSELDL